MCPNGVVLDDFVQTNPIVTSYWFRFMKIYVHLDYAVVDKVHEFRIENQIGGGQFLFVLDRR